MFNRATYDCEICGKPRSRTGYKKVSHAKCSRIKQQRYGAAREKEAAESKHLRETEKHEKLRAEVKAVLEVN